MEKEFGIYYVDTGGSLSKNDKQSQYYYACATMGSEKKEYELKRATRSIIEQYHLEQILKQEKYEVHASIMVNPPKQNPLRNIDPEIRKSFILDFLESAYKIGFRSITVLVDKDWLIDSLPDTVDKFSEQIQILAQETLLERIIYRDREKKGSPHTFFLTKENTSKEKEKNS